MSGSYIVAGARTPIGKMSGALASFSAADLGGFAIAAALQRAGVAPHEVEHVIMGQVLMAGQGQVPSRQAASKAGIPMSVPSVNINKVCLSGLNSIYLGNQMIMAGEADIVVAGGMESMTNAPYLAASGRGGFRYGHTELQDSIITDGLWCAFDACLMGKSTEDYTAGGISREEQDQFAMNSNVRAAAADHRAPHRSIEGLQQAVVDKEADKRGGGELHHLGCGGRPDGGCHGQNMLLDECAAGQVEVLCAMAVGEVGHADGAQGIDRKQHRLGVGLHHVPVEVVDGLDEGVELQVPAQAPRRLEILRHAIEFGLRQGAGAVLAVLPLFLDFGGELLRTDRLHQNLDARLVLVVTAAMLVVNPQDGIQVSQQVFFLQAFVDDTANDRGTA